MQVAFDNAKSQMIEALAKKPEGTGEWAKLIKAAEDVLRAAGVRQ